MKSLWQKIVHAGWWWGTAVFAFVAALGPYGIWNVMSRGWSWSSLFRIPLAPNAVFDSYLYFQQMSLLEAGVVTGSFGWFTWPLVAFMRVAPEASIPELWVISRALTLVLLFWIGPWAFQRITGVGVSSSRWLILCFWFSFLLPISLRPGPFSWYLPFAFLGFALLALVARALKRGNWMSAGVMAIAALLLLAVYPWFLLFALLVLITLFAVSCLLTRRAWSFVLLAFATVSVCAYAVLLVTGLSVFPVPVAFSVYERNGIGISHVPLISNTVLAILLWLSLLMTARTQIVDRSASVIHLGWWWIALLVLWLSPPLIGLDILNDHFILVAAMLSWITFGFFVISRPPGVEPARRDQRVSLAVAMFASVFFVYILQKALRHIGKFDPYAIHLSIWLALASAAWVQWLQLRGRWQKRWWRMGKWFLLGMTVAIGMLGLLAVIRRNAPEMTLLWPRLPAIEWVRAYVPSGEAVCADPSTARSLAAHGGHIVYPSAANLMLKETDETQHRRLQVIGAAYDVVTAGDEQHFPYLINGVRATACDQFAGWAKLLKKLGWSQERIDRAIGCRRQRAAAFEEDVMTAIRARRVDAAAFRGYCPWVLIPDTHKAFWSLPGSYEEIRVSGDTSIWHIR